MRGVHPYRFWDVDEGWRCGSLGVAQAWGLALGNGDFVSNSGGQDRSRGILYRLHPNDIGVQYCFR